ncbi:MAG: hypothetical protein ACXVHQ_42105, partial [Solirubrobacteraceae bacterium]
ADLGAATQRTRQVTISTAFAFAVLVSVGVQPACMVYAAAWLIAGRCERTAPVTVVFNAAQYVLSLAGDADQSTGASGGANDVNKFEGVRRSVPHHDVRRDLRVSG